VNGEDIGGGSYGIIFCL